MTYMRLLSLFAASYICCSAATAHTKDPGDCEVKLLPKGFVLSIDERPDHDRYIQELQNDIDARTLNSRLPVRPTQIRGMVNYENIMFMLERGNSDQIVPVARTAASMVDQSYDRLVKLGNLIVAKHKLTRMSEAETKELVDAELLFIAESKNFGENYGFAKAVMDLLESVAAGKGVPASGNIMTYDGNDGQVVLDLTTKSAINTANNVLKLWKWNGFAPTAEIKAMFGNNHYALRAKLERDVEELKWVNSFWRKAMNLWAQVLMQGSDKIPWLPEKYRQIALRVIGLQANQYMKELHLGYVQELVGITRARTPDGKLVLLNDAATTDRLLKTAEDLAAATIGNDLFTTYARVRYFAASWTQLNKMAKDKAAKDPTYMPLVKKLEEAEKARQSAGDLPYLHEPNRYQELTLLGAQTVYIMAGEEWAVGGVRDHLLPWIQQFLN